MRCSISRGLRSARSRRSTRRVIASFVAVCAIVLSGVGLAAAAPAAAATYEFVIDSLAPAGDDANPGDGQCSAPDGTCTLRAALQESNALNVALQESNAPNAALGVVSITVAPGLSGTMMTTQTINAAHWMT